MFGFLGSLMCVETCRSLMFCLRFPEWFKTNLLVKSEHIFGSFYYAEDMSQCSNLDLEVQTFGAHLGLVSRFCTFQRQKQTQ